MVKDKILESKAVNMLIRAYMRKKTKDGNAVQFLESQISKYDTEGIIKNNYYTQANEIFEQGYKKELDREFNEKVLAKTESLTFEFEEKTKAMETEFDKRVQEKAKRLTPTAVDVVKSTLIGGISKCIYDHESEVLEVNGWFLPRVLYSSIEVEHNARFLGAAVLDQRRFDVYKDYPEYNEKEAGYCFQSNEKGVSENDSIIINVYNGRKLVKSVTKRVELGKVTKRLIRRENTITDRLEELKNSEEFKEYVFSLYENDVAMAEHMLGVISRKADSDSRYSTLEKKFYIDVSETVVLGGISNLIFDSFQKKLALNGWFIPRSNYDKVVIEQNGVVLGRATLGLIREDVLKNYPYLNEGKAGFSFNCMTPECFDETKEVSVNVYCRGKIVHKTQKIADKESLEPSQVRLYRYQDYLFTEILDTYNSMRELKRALRFNEIVKSLEEYMPWHDERYWKKLNGKKSSIISGITSVESEFISIFSEKNVIYFRDAELEYQYAESLWVIINEILINQEYYFETASEAPVVFDCGANIGLAIYYFKHRFPNCHINAFEPMSIEYSILKRNIARNHWNNVTIHKIALSDVNGQTELIIPLADSLGASLTSRPTEGNSEVITIKEIVETAILSNYVSKYENIDYLKMDIEGAEVKVLRSIKDYLLNNVTHIFCEYHYGETVEDNDLQELVALLTDAGFKLQISKSPSYQKMTSVKTMNYVGKRCSNNIWGKR